LFTRWIGPSLADGKEVWRGCSTSMFFWTTLGLYQV